MSDKWYGTEIEDLTGKTIAITGASSGIGLAAAFTLAGRGAEVILAVRNEGKGAAAIKQIRTTFPQAKISMMKIDLSDLNSIRHFAAEFLEHYQSLDILINNAGVMIPPHRYTNDGFELQFGSNHLGHFALTGLLLPLLVSTRSSRVVTLASLAAHKAEIYFDNLDGSKWYKPMDFYRQSKLANLLFSRELNNKFREHQIDSISVACHPGLAHTNLSSRGSEKTANLIFRLISKMITQPAEMGALPTLYAAVSSLSGGEYIGPDGRGARKGFPKNDPIVESLYDKSISEKLWTISEELTGVKFDFSVKIGSK